MASERPKNSDSEAPAKITAAHLAGLRPRPPREPASPIGKWDRSTIFIAGFAFAMLFLPEVLPIFRLGARSGAPHSAVHLLVLLGLTSCFGIFPVVFAHHFYIQQACGRPTLVKRVLSAGIAFALMTCTTAVMKPLLGYEQKVAENARAWRLEHDPRSRSLAGDAIRSPASDPAETIREGIELFR